MILILMVGRAYSDAETAMLIPAWGYALFFLLLVFMLFGLLYVLPRYIGIKRITYKRYFSQAGVFEGQSVTLIEEIHNNYFLPLFFIDVESYLRRELRIAKAVQPEKDQEMQRFISRFFLMPHNHVKRSINIECTKRGFYELDTAEIFFYRYPVMLRSKANLHVYPRPLPSKESQPIENEIQSMISVSRSLLRDPFNFIGVREYLPGDPFSSINYKATAKTGELKVNNRDFISSRNFMLYVDFHTTFMEKPPEDNEYKEIMERALSYAADMVWKAIQAGYNAGFSANCRMVNEQTYVRHPIGSGQGHYIQMLEEMAKIRIQAGCSIKMLINMDLDTLRNADIYIMTLAMNQRLDETIEALKIKGNQVIVNKL